MKLVVAPEGKPSFDEAATTVEIDDEGAGEFVVIRQSDDSAEAGTIRLNPEEWPAVRAAIDKMVKECR